MQTDPYNWHVFIGGIKLKAIGYEMKSFCDITIDESMKCTREGSYATTILANNIITDLSNRI